MSISCIVPVYNQAQFIGAALDSIFAQTLPIDEVIVVDDASQDNVLEVLKACEKPLQLIQLPKNSGPAAARNAGIRAASADWLTFLDADDVWHVEKTARQMRAFEADEGLDYCLTYRENFWEASMADEEARLREQGHPMTIPGAAFVFQAMLLRRSTFERVGYLDETYRMAEDSDWFARAQDLGMKRIIMEECLIPSADCTPPTSATKPPPTRALLTGNSS